MSSPRLVGHRRPHAFADARAGLHPAVNCRSRAKSDRIVLISHAWGRAPKLSRSGAAKDRRRDLAHSRTDVRRPSRVHDGTAGASQTRAAEILRHIAYIGESRRCVPAS